jgi:CRP-like cAMP-binding protein
MSSTYTESEFLPIILIDLNKPWENVLELGIVKSFQSRNIIVRQDMPFSSNGMYLVRRGIVKLSYISSSGKERTHFYIGQGSLFHEIPMMHATRNYAFTCMEPTETVFLPKHLLTPDFMRQYPELVLNMFESSTIKCRILYTSLCGEHFFNSFANVCRVLYSMHLFNRVKGKGMVVPYLSQQELAAYLGMHRSSLHKALSRLRDEGVIGAYSKRELLIHHAETLMKYSLENDEC